MRRDDLLDRITPEQRLLLRAALCSGGEAARAWEAWRARIAVEDVDHQSQRLLPIVARRLAVLAPDDPVRRLVRGVYRHAWVKNRLLIRDAAALASVLQSRHVPVVVLKGPTLVPYYGGDLGARPMFDVDLLVPPERVADAVAALLADGWRSRLGLAPRGLMLRVVPRRHSTSFSRDLEGQLDLHWHVLATSVAPNADDAFWSRSVRFNLGGEDVLALSAPDLLLHVLVHGALSDTGGHVQWVADAAAVLPTTSEPASIERFAEQALAHGVVLLVRAALDAVGEIVGDGPVEALRARIERTRAPAVERIARAAISRRRSPTTGRIVEGLAMTGGADAGWRTRLAALAGEWIDLSLVRRPFFYALYTSLDRPAFMARLGRRAFGTFVRTPADTDATYEIGTTLDFADPATADRHLGPGWWELTEHGIGSRGWEARVVLDPAGVIDADLELELELRSTDGADHIVGVRVNEYRLARLEAGRVAATHVVCVPRAIARRFVPLEIAFGSVRGFRRRALGRVWVRLRRLRLAAV